MLNSYCKKKKRMELIMLGKSFYVSCFFSMFLVVVLDSILPNKER